MIPMEFSPYYIYVIAGIVLVLMLIYTFFMRRRGQGMIDDFASQNPDAATLYTSAGSSVATTLKSSVALDDIIQVEGIDGVTALQPGPAGRAVYTAKMDGSMLVVPGEHTLSVSASHSRPGVVYKTVSTVYGPIDLRVRLEPYKSYHLTFDRTTQQFGIQER